MPGWWETVPRNREAGQGEWGQQGLEAKASGDWPSLHQDLPSIRELQ